MKYVEGYITKNENFEAIFILKREYLRTVLSTSDFYNRKIVYFTLNQKKQINIEKAHSCLLKMISYANFIYVNLECNDSKYIFKLYYQQKNKIYGNIKKLQQLQCQMMIHHNTSLQHLLLKANHCVIDSYHRDYATLEFEQITNFTNSIVTNFKIFQKNNKLNL